MRARDSHTRYNWSNSGDYTASPPTGFWPNVTAVIERHFMAAMGFGFQRVFNATSDGTMDLVANDLADITEPYWTIDAYYNGRSRQHFFATVRRNTSQATHARRFVLGAHAPRAIIPSSFMDVRLVFGKSSTN